MDNTNPYCSNFSDLQVLLGFRLDDLEIGVRLSAGVRFVTYMGDL
jgi:hypothetical protein